MTRHDSRSEIRLERTPCFGSCPVYALSLFSDGRAVWKGEHFVERIGDHSGRFDRSAFDRLLTFATRVGFFEWDPEYTFDVTDHAGTRISISRPTGESHSVYQYATDEPGEYWTLATLIDGVGATVDWDRARP